MKFKYYLFTCVIISIIASEIILRLTGTYLSYTEQNHSPYTPLYPKESLSAYLHYLPHEKRIEHYLEFDQIINANSIGLNDIEHKKTPSPNTYQIIALGDSFTEGTGTNPKDSWPRQLQTHLNLIWPNVTVINGGLNGSDPGWSYKLFTDKLLNLKPNCVILSINTTDIDDLKRHGGLERFQHNRCYVPSTPTLRTVEFCFRYSHIVRALMIQVLGYNWSLQKHNEDHKRNAIALNHLTKIITAFEQLASQYTFKLILLFHPTDIDEAKDPKRTIFYNIMTQQHHENTSTINTFSAISNAGKKMNTLLYYPIDGHHTPMGYTVLAKAISSELINQKLINP